MSYGKGSSVAVIFTCGLCGKEMVRKAMDSDDRTIRFSCPESQLKKKTPFDACNNVHSVLYTRAGNIVYSMEGMTPNAHIGSPMNGGQR